jgi:cytochrome c-type biogenesis protein CcmH/NrfG
MTAAESRPTANPGLPARQIYVIGLVSLLVGAVVGYGFLPKQSSRVTASPQPSPAAASASVAGNHPKLTLEQMKQMADVRASALVEKSKTEPKNSQLLVQIAEIYQATHQFKEASDYYDRTLQIDPKNASVRTQLASCLYYSGDVDGALAQLNQVLTTSPKDTNALFNLGMIKYRGKNDHAGAIAAWQQLLKVNPNLDRKPMVEQLIAEAESAPVAKN